MKPGLVLGHTHETTIVVTAQMQAQFPDGPVHALYSTAAMIQHMEWAARQHILPYLEPGEEGVGYHVDVKHLAPAPLGSTVRIRSTVTNIQPRRITSHVEAWLNQTLLGAGHLTQAVVPLSILHQHPDQPEPDFPQAPGEPEPATLTQQADSTIRHTDSTVRHTDSPTQFRLAVLRWETGLLPCTRYDEWLICRVALRHQGQHLTHEGAFLLRHELDEWLTAMRQLADGPAPAAPFQSDFLEPVLQVQVTPDLHQTGGCTLTLNLNKPISSGGWSGPSLKASFTLEAPTVRTFVQQLAAQLDGFPSRL